MGQKLASLELELTMATGGAIADINRFGGAVDKVSAQAIRGLDKIDAATKQVGDMSPAIASMQKFAETVTQSGVAAARERLQAERSGEAMVRQLERQNAAYGKSREELRSMRGEERARVNDLVGNTDLARRIRAEEAALYDKEVAAARRAAQAADALAQEKAVAAEQAVAAAEREAQAVRSAAQAHMMFEAAARKGLAVYRELQAAEAALEREAAAARSRAAAEAAVNAQLTERSRLEAALERNTGVGRTRATDAGATFSALAARAAEDEAQAVRSAAQAHVMFEAAARNGMAALREHEAAAERDANILARLRAMVDPAAAAHDRLNRELAEARRVMTAAGASAEELARAESMLADRASLAAQRHDLMAGSARKNGSALQTVALQLPDITQGLLTGQKPMTVFIQQGFQIVQVAQMAEGGLRGFGKELSGLALRFAPFLGALAAAGAGFAFFTRWINQGVTNDQLTRDLGKITGGANATKEELYKLKDATITWGDVTSALFSEVGKDVSAVFVGDMKGMGKDVKAVLDDLTSYGKMALAGLYAGVAGTRAYLGELSNPKALLKVVTGNDPQLLERTYGKAYDVADKYLTKLGTRVRAEAIENARERNAKTIGFNSEPKPKIDRHAEQLAREAAAVEAQIAGLYRLAEAYGVSGGAALIAEARVKAETAAIKKRGEIEAFVSRELRLAVAQRVSDAAKGTASLREQAINQEIVNASVVAGNKPAQLAADLMRDRMADLPLLAALEAAQKTKDLVGMAAAEKALEGQRAARDRLTDAEREGRRVAAMSSGADRLAELAEEQRLIGATDAARVHALAALKATQEAEASGWTGQKGVDYIQQQIRIADGQSQLKLQTDAYNESLSYQADLLDVIASNAADAARGMADAFGEAGRALGDMASIFAGHLADQERLELSRNAELRSLAAIQDVEKRTQAEQRVNTLHSLKSGAAQVEMYGDMLGAAKSFFKEGSTGYRAVHAAEKAFRLAQLAMSIQSMVQNAVETTARITNAAAQAAADGTAGVAAQSKLSWPVNLVAMAATAAALVAAGISVFGGGGGGSAAPKSNEGRGTILGDPDAQSESITRAIAELQEVDTLMLSTSRQMAGHLRSIDDQIGSFAALVVRSGNLDASASVKDGFQPNMIGSLLGNIPLIGGFLSGLFGSKTTILGSGLYGKDQSLGSILNSGFDADTYTDTKKKSSFLGITTSTKYKTQYGAADPALEGQIGLLLRSFNDAIAAAAGPLGESTDAIQQRLNGFIVSIGKIDLQNLTGEEIEAKLTAIFAAAADDMAGAAFPGIAQFQRAGEGLFQTLVRVASTVEAVTASLDQLGTDSRTLGIDAKLGLSAQFDSIGDLTSAVDGYFQAFYSKEEQAAAKAAQFGRVFDSLGLALPATLTGFRQLVEAQDLTTAAGQATFATLLQLAPAFADLKAAMDGAKSAADVLAERQDLERKLLEVQGDTAAIRALDLAKLDASNRGLQEQIWAVQAAQDAAKAAEQLRDAWKSVGDTLLDEVRRIRGLNGTAGGGSFAVLMGQFNAANSAARAGDIDVAKTLPQLSRSLLDAAALAATSRQELDRVQAQTAATLEATYDVVSGLAGAAPAATASTLSSAATAQTAAMPATANDGLVAEVRALREENAETRRALTAALATIAGNTGQVARKLDDVTGASGGDAVSVTYAA